MWRKGVLLPQLVDMHIPKFWREVQTQIVIIPGNAIPMDPKITLLNLWPASRIPPIQRDFFLHLLLHVYLLTLCDPLCGKQTIHNQHSGTLNKEHIRSLDVWNHPEI